MFPPYRVKTIVLASGERLPILLDSEGCPIFEATAFALAEIRGRGLASNTLASVLRSISVFYLFLGARGIDLAARIEDGELLSLREVEDLARQCRRPANELLSLRNGMVSSPSAASPERVRMRANEGLPREIAADVAAARLRYIRMYIRWLADDCRSRHGVSSALATRLGESVSFVADAIECRLPNSSGRNSFCEREGLPDEHVAELLRITEPLSASNPWRDWHARYRNALLIRWLLYLGLRVGELLGVRVEDVVLYRQEVTIHRRADDPHDPRRYQPQAKTRARVLRVSAELLSQTQEYVLNHRSKLSGAKRNPFLFVASRSGEPMSLAAVAKVFKELRSASPTLPRRLSAHVLRHTWNDMFSERMDSERVSPELEQQARSYLMGWARTSNTAAIYTRRHTRKKAWTVALQMQDQLVGKEDRVE